MRAKAEHLSNRTEADRSGPPSWMHHPRSRGRTLIALDIAATCENAGATTLYPQTRAEAERLIETDGITAAVVDYCYGMAVPTRCVTN
jgi:hypothetical protein